MHSLTTSDVRNLDWGDATFHGFRWEPDCTLRIWLSHGSLPISEWLCPWSTNLVVDWSVASARANPSRTGPLLTISGDIQPTPAGRWSVKLDFGSDGHISFETQEILSTLDES